MQAGKAIVDTHQVKYMMADFVDPGEGNERPSHIQTVKIDYRDMRRSLEAEDAEHIFRIVGAPAGEPSNWISVGWVFLYRNQVGRKLPSELFELGNFLGSLAGRKGTFPRHRWSEAESLEMARTGFYFHGNTGEVRCFCCQILFRDLHPLGGRCPWQIHVELVPNCLQLKRYQSDGNATTSSARRQRSNSESSAKDLVFGN